MQALILMAGHGQRFKDKGYTFPKPLIDVAGKPMIQWVIESLPEDCTRYIFVAQKAHAESYGLENVLSLLTEGRSELVLLDEVTKGAACSALMARDLIRSREELIIANSDQYVEYSQDNFKMFRYARNANGIIFTFKSLHPKWSYVKLRDIATVSEVVEKRVVSTDATCGIYYFATGSLFMEAADSMIRKNIRTNGEFYLAPVYNELIQNGRIISPFWVDQMYGLGTPEDLENFLRHV